MNFVLLKLPNSGRRLIVHWFATRPAADSCRNLYARAFPDCSFAVRTRGEHLQALAGLVA